MVFIMKILHVPHFFVPCLSAGGVVNAAYQIAKKQVDEGHDVHVYTRRHHLWCLCHPYPLYLTSLLLVY